MTRSRIHSSRYQRLEVGLRTPLLIFGLLVLAETLSSLSVDIGFSVSCVDALAAANNKDKGRRRKSGSSNSKGKGGFGGFGKPPLTLDDFLASVKTSRLPKDASSVPCPCGSLKRRVLSQDDTTRGQELLIQKTYAECCGPLLENPSPGGSCRTPLQVLESRYTAFCFRHIGHVIRTTHEECRDYRDDKVAWAKNLDKEGLFDSFEFVGLEVLDENDETGTIPTDDHRNDESNEAFLEFRVRLKGRSLEEIPTRSRSLSSIHQGEETIISERSRFLRDPELGVWKYAGGDVRSTVQGLEDTTLNV